MSGPTTPAGRPLYPETASWLARIGALLIDWLASYAVSFFILQDLQHPAFVGLNLAVFLVETTVGVALTGASFGQKLLRLSVHQLDGRPLSLVRAFQRQLLICLVIPPLVFRADGRGLHDLWTNSAVFPRR